MVTAVVGPGCWVPFQLQEIEPAGTPFWVISTVLGKVAVMPGGRSRLTSNMVGLLATPSVPAGSGLKITRPDSELGLSPTLLAAAIPVTVGLLMLPSRAFQALGNLSLTIKVTTAGPPPAAVRFPAVLRMVAGRVLKVRLGTGFATVSVELATEIGSPDGVVMATVAWMVVAPGGRAAVLARILVRRTTRMGAVVGSRGTAFQAIEF